MSASRFAAVVDALVALIEDTDALQVFDGAANTADVPTDYVIVGGTDDPDADAGDISADWKGLGARSREERSEVTCCVVAWTGNDPLKTVRDRALGIVDQIETAMRDDPTLAAVISGGWAHITRAVPSQGRNTNGAYVRVVFTVTYQCRI